jgi:hypothetical protein
VLHDLGAGELSRACERASHTGRVDVALDGVEHGADEVLLVHDRQEALRLRDADQLGLETEVAVAGVREPEPVHPLLGVGQQQAAGEVDAAVDAGDALDLVVELDGVLLQRRHVGVTVEGVHATGGVPRRARRQLRALEEHGVGDPGLGQVVEHAGPDHASTDHDDLRGCPHLTAPSRLVEPVSRSVELVET